MSLRRALHFVFKIGDRKSSIKFFRDILGMKVLRHEEFEDGCKASCNGPYDGKWSKTMIGYGAEDSHFVCELTYNYGISEYALGNDFLGLYIQSSEAVTNARSADWPLEQDGDYQVMKAPGGHKCYLLDKPQPTEKDPVFQVCLSSSKLITSVDYWSKLLGMTVQCQNDAQATLEFAPDQAKLLLKDIGESVDHAKGFGRIAFSCPAKELKDIEEVVSKADQTILTPYVSLDTPGKATVQVVILADPDGHEICFVGDEGFRALSQPDPVANELLDAAINEDKSEQWFAENGGKLLA